jgi:hypothetical protein
MWEYNGCLKNIPIPIIFALATIAWFPTRTATAEAGPAMNKAILYVDLEGRSPAEKLAGYVLQGLANRDAARVLVRLGADNRWSEMRLDFQHPEFGRAWSPEAADVQRARLGSEYFSDFWVAYLKEHRGFNVERLTLEQFIDRERERLQGLILYRDLSDLSIAATMAGLRDALPVTAAIRRQLVAAGINLPILFDVAEARKTYSAGLTPREGAHQWAIENLLPEVATDGAVSRARSYGLDRHDTLTDIDHAVQNRWFVYDLNHEAIANDENGAKGFEDHPDHRMVERILSSLDPWSAVWGWGKPEENNYIRSLSRNQLIGICGGVPNTSFFRKLEDDGASWQQSHVDAGDIAKTVEDKVYIAFMVNEGDTIKNAYGLMGDGAWLHPERGEIPINWGINPYLLTTHPALMRYYYETSSPNDYFFSATSGWGYTHLPWIPAESRNRYANLINQGLDLADTRFLDLWWIRPMETEGVLGNFLKKLSVQGITDWDNRSEFIDGKYDVPVLKSFHYYTLDHPEAFAERLEFEFAEVEGPWPLIVYGARVHGSPYRFAQVMKHLPNDRFEAVTLDRLFAIASLLGDDLDGRPLYPGRDRPVGSAP